MYVTTVTNALFRRVSKFVSREKNAYYLRHVCLSVFCLSVRCQHGSHWTDLCDVSYGGVEGWDLLRKSVEKLQIWLKMGKKIGHFSGRPRHFNNVDRRAKYFVPRKQGKGTLCDISKATLNTFILLTATCMSTTIRKECIVGFPWRLWLGKHSIILSFTYIAYLGFDVCLSVHRSISVEKKTN